MKRKLLKKPILIICTLIMLAAALAVTAFALNKEVTIYASNIQLDSDLVLTDDTTLIMDRDLDIDSITGDYTLTVTGEGSLLVENEGLAINVRSLIVETSLAAVSYADGYVGYAIQLTHDMYFSADSLYVEGGSGIRSEQGDVELHGNTMIIYADGGACIFAQKGEVSLSGAEAILVSKGEYLSESAAVIDSYGKISIDMDTGYFKGEVISLYSREGGFDLDGYLYVIAKDGGIVTENAGELDFNGISLTVEAGHPIVINGYAKMDGDHFLIGATKAGAAAIKAVGDIHIGGSTVTVRTSGGHGIASEEGTVYLELGNYEISGPDKSHRAVYAQKALKEDGNLKIAHPEGASFNGRDIIDQNTVPAREVVIYADPLHELDFLMEAPTDGAIPKKDKSVTHGLAGYLHVKSIVWYENGKSMAEGAAFKAGCSYTAEVKLSVGTSYALFMPDLTCTVNGKAQAVSVNDTGSTAVVYVKLGECPETLNEVNLSATPPIAGKMPSYTVSVYKNAIASDVSWEVSDNGSDGSWKTMAPTEKFTVGKHYRMTLYLDAADGYIFPIRDGAPALKVFTNGMTSRVFHVYDQSDSECVGVTASFGAVNPSVISKITVTDVIEPKAGAKPDYTLNLLGTGYKLSAINSVGWYDGTLNTVAPNDTFKSGQTYTVIITLEAEDGHSFNSYDQLSATVNGNTAQLEKPAAGEYYRYVRYTFTCGAAQIDRLDVTDITPPAEGNTPDYTALTDAPELYKVTEIVWYDPENDMNEMLPTDTFKSGQRYMITVVVEPTVTDGEYNAKFNDKKTSVTVNGIPVTKDPEKWDDVSAGPKKLRIFYTFEPYAFTTQPTSCTGAVGDTFDVTWDLNFTPDRIDVIYRSGTTQKIYDTVEASSASGSYSFCENEAVSYTFMLKAYRGGELLATSNSFVITWNEYRSDPSGCARGDTCPMTPFTDLKKTTWYHDGVHFCIMESLMNGTAADKFSPNMSMSRAMVVTVLYRLEGSPEVDITPPFTDIKTGWYYNAVKWAYANNIVTGVSNTEFDPNGDVTREQIATILYRYAAYKGKDVSASAALDSFPDHAKTGKWAKTAMKWAVAEGLVTGAVKDSLTVLDPKGVASRAQVATILYRFCKA